MLPIYGKKTLIIFFSRTNGQMALKHGLLHQVLKYYQDCSFDDLGLTLTFLRQAEIWENTDTLDFIKSFECFGQKMIIKVVLMSTLRLINRRGQGHCLTFDPGLS